MMGKDPYRYIIVPMTTFILGIFIQLLIQWLIPLGIVIPLGLTLIAIVLVLLFVTSLYMIDSIRKKFDTIEKHLMDVAKHAGLRGEFIEDGKDGQSYRRSAELVKNAKLSVLIVSHWEPLVQTSLDDARSTYFEAIQAQIEQHKNEGIHDRPFHCRIVQIPKRYQNNTPQYETDLPFFNHLKYLAEVQQSHHHICLIKRVNIRINTTFIIIDRKHIIIPVTAPSQTEHHVRYGTLLFEDNQGHLVKCLENMYRFLDTYAQPVLLEELKNV